VHVNTWEPFLAATSTEALFKGALVNMRAATGATTLVRLSAAGSGPNTASSASTNADPKLVIALAETVQLSRWEGEHEY
jgi:hypothetical protein